MPACTPAIASEPIGNRLMLSTPHASTISSAPDEIMFAARFTANWLEPHCESTVEHVMLGERPPVSHAVRVTLNACAPTLLMHPPITWPTASDGTFARFRISSHHLGEHFLDAHSTERLSFCQSATGLLLQSRLLYDFPPVTPSGARSRIFTIDELPRLAEI